MLFISLTTTTVQHLITHFTTMQGRGLAAGRRSHMEQQSVNPITGNGNQDQCKVTKPH